MEIKKDVKIFMKEYYRFLSADLLSQFSSGVMLSAISWYAISWYKSNSLVSNLTNTNLLSGLLITVLIIPIIDKIKENKIIQISLLIKTLMILSSIICCTLFKDIKIGLFIIALANGISWNIYFPASKKFIQNISNIEELNKNNSLSETIMQIGLFSSGLISGILLKYTNILKILYLILLLSFISTLLSITLKKHSNNKKNKNNINNKYSNYSNNYIYLLLIGIVLYIPFVGANEINTILPGYVTEILKGNSIIYGSIDMMYGIGAILSGVLVSYLYKKIKETNIVKYIFICSIIIGVILSINKSIIISYTLLFILGIIGPSIRIIINTLTMKTVNSKSIGKLMSIWNIISILLQILLIKALGNIMDSYGANKGFILYSITMIIGLIITLFIFRKDKYNNIKK
ncbi:MFS transporter [Apilactobacillus kunkeei]|uniref:MFS transporter n=2 Tax=Lactobacillaceae TaxID=33958 RepID=UPI00333F2A14